MNDTFEAFLVRILGPKTNFNLKLNIDTGFQYTGIYSTIVDTTEALLSKSSIIWTGHLICFVSSMVI